MSTLEREVIEKFRQLAPDARQRVLQTLSSTAQSSFDYDAWWAEVETLQAEIGVRIGDTGTIGSLSLLDELREEAS
jgi:hypothetical protein